MSESFSMRATLKTIADQRQQDNLMNYCMENNISASFAQIGNSIEINFSGDSDNGSFRALRSYINMMYETPR